MNVSLVNMEAVIEGLKEEIRGIEEVLAQAIKLRELMMGQSITPSQTLSAAPSKNGQNSSLKLSRLLKVLREPTTSEELWKKTGYKKSYLSTTLSRLKRSHKIKSTGKRKSMIYQVL